MRLRDSVDIFVEEKFDYFNNWIFDEPIIFEMTKYAELNKLQSIMFRLISHLGIHFEDYQHLMPVSDRVFEILKIANKYPYKLGTYRTDFVFDKNMNIRIIEITCRMALNGIFQAAIFDKHAKKYREIHNYREHQKGSFNLYTYIEHLINGRKKIAVLIGNDQKNESRIFCEIFERAGYTTEKIHFTEIDTKIDDLNNSFIVSELAFEELLSLKNSSLEKLSAEGMINDLRTIFLTHDKRFFSLLGNTQFLNNILSDDEIELLKKFYVPTYSSIDDDRPTNSEVEKYKNRWIIKHRALGKSQKIYGGAFLDQSKWIEILNEIDTGEFIIQEWIDQPHITGTVNGITYNDYMTGTLLFFDDHFFGLGEYRTSSHPIINITDHRKASHLFV